MRVARYRPEAAANLWAMPAFGEHHPAFEEYCECIFELDEDDVAVIQARIAERLQVSRPAVSEMIRRLEAEGLITTDGAIRLTTSGQALAQLVVRRHRIAERFLTDMLGLSWADAHHEAGKWEHVMSEPSSRRWTACSAARPRARTATRSRAPYHEPVARTPRRCRGRSLVHRQPHSRRARVHAGPARLPRGVAASFPAASAC